MVNYQHYAYKVIWSEEDGEYIGLCAEFPSLSFLHKNSVKAFEGITKLVGDVVQDMIINEEKIPEPLSEKKYSGRILLRVLPEEHRMLAIKAAEQGVSINRYINHKIAE